MLAVSTGSNEKSEFYERVHVIDLATGQQRGAPVALRGPLGALRLSDDGIRLLIFQYLNITSPDSNLVWVIDTRRARIVQRLLHTDREQARIDDAHFAAR